MSVGTVLVVLGLLVALGGLGLGFRSRARARPALSVATSEAPVRDAGDVLERMHDVFEATDQAVRMAVVTVVAGLVIAGIGAFLGSDANAFGGDISHSGVSGHHPGHTHAW